MSSAFFSEVATRPTALQSINGNDFRNIKRQRAIIGGTSPYDHGGGIVGLDIAQSGDQSNPDVRLTMKLRQHSRDPRDNYLKDLQRYANLFVHRKPTDRIPSRGAGFSAYNLETINYRLHLLTNDLGVDVITPEWFMENYRYTGILHTDVSENAMRSGERTVSVHRQGDYEIPNFFGSGVQGRDYLWFLVKRVRVADRTLYLPNSQAYAQELTNVCPVLKETWNDRTLTIEYGKPELDADGTKKMKRYDYVTRVVPLVTPDRYVPDYCMKHDSDEDVEKGMKCDCPKTVYCETNADGDCIYRTGYAIRVGVVDVNKTKGTAVPLDALTNTVRMMNAATIPLKVWLFP